jgi:hypothetical protein
MTSRTREIIEYEVKLKNPYGPTSMVPSLGNFTHCQTWGKMPKGAKINGVTRATTNITKATSKIIAIVFPVELAIINLL